MHKKATFQCHVELNKFLTYKETNKCHRHNITKKNIDVL